MGKGYPSTTLRGTAWIVGSGLLAQLLSFGPIQMPTSGCTTPHGPMLIDGNGDFTPANGTVFPIQISHSTTGSVKPQVAINNDSWAAYAVWIEEESVPRFCYAGSSQNGTNWSKPINYLPVPFYSPPFTFEFFVVDGRLELWWEGQPQMVIDPDIDGDMWLDFEDPYPMSYFTEGMDFSVDERAFEPIYGFDPHDPADGPLDPDNDGLDNAREFLWCESGADPHVQDVFVEMDWMWRDHVQFERRNHRLSQSAKDTIVDLFDAHGISLHIDDGTRGYDLGGGQTIPFEGDFLVHFFAAPATGGNRRPGAYDDYWDYKGQQLSPTDYFDWDNRKDIFHYIVFAHHITVPGFPQYWGYAEIQGDDMAMEETSFDLRVFMHELGHNLGLEHSEDENGNDPNPTVNPGPDETVMDTVMYWAIGGSLPLDYLDAEWLVLPVRLGLFADGD